MDKETKQRIDDYLAWLRKMDTPEYRERTEKRLKRFWEITRDYAWGSVDADAFDELDEIR